MATASGYICFLEVNSRISKGSAVEANVSIQMDTVKLL